MLKKILITTLFIGTITFAFFQNFYIRNRTELFVSYCEEAIDYIEIDDFDSAKEKVILINKEWEKSEKMLEALVEHSEIDKIETTLRLVTAYTYNKEKSMFLSEAQVLTFLFGHIKYIDSLAIENIL